MIEKTSQIDKKANHENDAVKSSCGCVLSTKKKDINKTVFKCSQCGGLCCSKHYFFKVDGNNISITKAHFKNGICSKCYEEKSRV